MTQNDPSTSSQDANAPTKPIEEGKGKVRVVGMVAGMGSGLTKITVGHGFDTVKTRIQVAPQYYRGAIDCFFQIVRKEGPLALYKGATPPAIGWTAIDSILLGSLHNYRLQLRNLPIFQEQIPLTGGSPPVSGSQSNGIRLNILGHSIAGLGAGVTSAFIATPIELLKVKLQLQHQAKKSDRQFSGPIDCARQVVRVQGVKGLWKGLAGSLAFRANFFWMFGSIEVFQRTAAKLQGTKWEVGEGTANFICGGLGSFAFWGMAVPADNVKNRVFGSSLHAPLNARSAVKEIWQQAGWRGFYRGLATSIIRAFPSNACAYFVYETILRAAGAEKTRA